MGWPEIGLLLAAGILGGLTGSIAGLASVATYPALLVAGLPPVAANVTNTVSLVFNGVGSVLGSQPELRGQGGWLRRIIPAAALGGVAGAALLLSTPAEGFEKVVPVLLGASAVLILLPRRAGPAHPERRAHAGWREGAAILAICVYGGYFGAAAGVLLLALLLTTGSNTLAHANAGKNVVLGVANMTAAVVFAVFAPVHWAAVVPMGAGCLIGSRLGPIVVRHAPSGLMRALIGAAGIALAIKLGVEAYG
ncbi:sulfite exporter TauE/SafE family protein [Mycobacterium sp. GA-2829]|uniref:sulfite exporter TauE/SafE family protein n=1 Tax=Mycobacterium sp. GA-2829 TaxID=1772283 RepID=UPI0007403A59|nr:sulfite exporter TauE/SafE family protein [Mycobacterium sp. GA-2829]KUI32308.1 transporter [Mycobacterium sp. GA-2829]